MREAKKIDRHLDDEVLWQWRDRALNDQDRVAAQNHLDNCASCRQRAEAMERLINAMQKVHHSVLPTLTEQMQLLRALDKQFVLEKMPNVLVNASRWLVRWLAPAVAILAALLVLLRQEYSSSTDALTSLLPEAPESQLLFADTDEQFQQAMWEMALSVEQIQK